MVFLPGISEACLACRCDDPGTVDEAYKRKGVIITARVVEIDTVAYLETVLESEVKRIAIDLKDDPKRLAFFTSKSLLAVKVSVIDRFKGENVIHTVTLYTPVFGGSCGFRFKLNQIYIIYASGPGFYSWFWDAREENKDIEKPHTYWTHACTRTRIFDESEADALRALRG